MTHICRLPRSIESLERIDKEQDISAKTVAFISYRSRLNIIVAAAARGEKGNGGGGRQSEITRF